MNNIEIARKIAKLFENNNAKIYLVGGSVRDYLIFNDFEDFDFATSLSPLEVIKILKIKDYDKSAISFGTVKCSIFNKNIEITTFRKESYKINNRHPKVEFIKDMQIDYLRRDFTLNALYLDLETNNIIDYCNGINDINNKIIKTIIDPIESFNIDPLRILRAIRFQSKLRYKLDDSIIDAIDKCKEKLLILSPYKIKEELNKFSLDDKELINLLIKYNIFDLLKDKML